MSVSTQVQYLHENRAWNWQWPQDGNRWTTGAQAQKGDPVTRHTPLGPSKHIVARRATRAAKRRAH